jgi:hypothetical protein
MPTRQVPSVQPLWVIKTPKDGVHVLTFHMQLYKHMELSMWHFTGSILQVSCLYFPKGGRISIMSKINIGSNSNEYY